MILKMLNKTFLKITRYRYCGMSFRHGELLLLNDSMRFCLGDLLLLLSLSFLWNAILPRLGARDDVGCVVVLKCGHITECVVVLLRCNGGK